MKNYALASIALITSQLIGCASVQLGDPARSAELKKFEPKPGVAQVFVCRDNSFLGRAITPTIRIDGADVANIRPNTFSYTEVPAGTHKVLSDTAEHNSVIDFTVQAGERKFFQSWITMGAFSGWGLIEEINEAKGKECVTNGNLVVAVPK